MAEYTSGMSLATAELPDDMVSLRGRLVIGGVFR
jgi:hypothetical protein